MVSRGLNIFPIESHWSNANISIYLGFNEGLYMVTSAQVDYLIFGNIALE